MMPYHARVNLKISNYKFFERKGENVVTRFSKLNIIQS